MKGYVRKGGGVTKDSCHSDIHATKTAAWNVQSGRGREGLAGHCAESRGLTCRSVRAARGAAVIDIGQDGPQGREGRVLERQRRGHGVAEARLADVVPLRVPKAKVTLPSPHAMMSLPNAHLVGLQCNPGELAALCATGGVGMAQPAQPLRQRECECECHCSNVSVTATHVGAEGAGAAGAVRHDRGAGLGLALGP